MGKYVYYCERCGTLFEVEADSDGSFPKKLVCPKCEYPHALKAFPASSMGCGCGPGNGNTAAGGG